MPRAKVPCHYCATMIDQRPPNFREVVGWAQYRKQGTNQITQELETGEYACATCIELIRNGIAPTQEGFDLDG